MEQGNLTDSLGDDSNCTFIDCFRKNTYIASYSLITVLGLIGNSYALVALIKINWTTQSYPFHVYMINLAVSDLLFVMTLPLRVVYYTMGQWTLGSFLCQISSYTFYVNLYCSIYFMVAMSITRFLAIVYPVQNLQLMTVNRARLVCVAIWVFICLLSSPFLMAGEDTTNPNRIKCFEPRSIERVTVMNYLSLVVGFGLPFLVILVCYAGIIRTLLSRTRLSRSLSGQKQQRAMGIRAIRMIVIVLLTFLICFLPYHVLRSVNLAYMTTPVDNKNHLKKYAVVTQCLAAANSCFDPLLYFFSGEGFRTRFGSRSSERFSPNPSRAQSLRETSRKSVESKQTGGQDTSMPEYV